MGFPRQEYWSGLSFPSPGDLPDPEIKLMSPAFPSLAGRLFTTEPSGKSFWDHFTNQCLRGHSRKRGKPRQELKVDTLPPPICLSWKTASEAKAPPVTNSGPRVSTMTNTAAQPSLGLNSILCWKRVAESVLLVLGSQLWLEPQQGVWPNSSFMPSAQAPCLADWLKQWGPLSMAFCSNLASAKGPSELQYRMQWSEIRNQSRGQKARP